MLIKQFSLQEKFPEQYEAEFFKNKSPPHTLRIIENIEYKSIELLLLDFDDADPELKKQNLSYRFSLLKSKNLRIENKTKDLLSMLKLKNPNLLQTITTVKSNPATHFQTNKSRTCR
jgi:hypothetical protein